MGRKYTANVTEVLLDAADVVAIVSEYVQLKKTGSNHKGLCPFHNEKSPSFMVSESKQLYHCFGCGASGNAIGFIMAIENFDFLDALEFLAEKIGFDLSPYLEKSNQRDMTPIKKDLYEVTKLTAIRYYKNLQSNKEALHYLLDRGLSAETIKKFGLGYSLDKWDDIISYIEKTNYSSKQLVDVGLIIPRKDNSGHYDRFRNRIMFPIFNVKGKVIGFGGRVMDKELPKYLNSPETIIFNKSDTLYGLNFAKNEISKQRKLIVVEGYMDVISLYQYDVKNVVATLGTALTERHGKLLKRYADEVILSYDSDEAGKNAALKGIEVLKKTGLKVRVLTLTDGMDPDDYIKKFGRPKFIDAINNAMYYVDYKIEIIKAKHNLQTNEGISDFIKDIIEVLKDLESDVEKNLYLEKVSSEVGVPYESIAKDLYGDEFKFKMKFRPKKKKAVDMMIDSSPIKRAPKKKQSLLDRLEGQLLRIAIDSGDGLEKISKTVGIENLTNIKIKKVFAHLMGIYNNERSYSLDRITDELDFELVKLIHYVNNNFPAAEDPLRELDSILSTYRKEQLQQAIKEIAEQKKYVLMDDSQTHEEKSEQYRLLNDKEMQLKAQRTELLNKLKK